MIFQMGYMEFCLWLLGLWRYSEIEKCDLDAVYRGLLKQPLFLVLVWNTKYLHFRCSLCSFNSEQMEELDSHICSGGEVALTYICFLSGHKS